jgi:hypothetical protein
MAIGGPISIVAAVWGRIDFPLWKVNFAAFAMAGKSGRFTT